MKQPTILFLAAALLLAVPALAGDGVFEIHQSCVATGCFPGDTAGLPVTITNPGSYRLTSNLSMPDVTITGIEITAASVTLDLGGFAIEGTTVCSWTGAGPWHVDCAPEAPFGFDGAGILAWASPVTVRNGTVGGIGTFGIVLVEGGTVEEVNVHDTANVAIQAAQIGYGANGDKPGTVRNCRIERAKYGGIEATTAEGNTILEVGGSGIYGSAVRNNSIRRTGGKGIWPTYGPVEGNWVRETDESCIEVFEFATVSNNVLVECGTAGITCPYSCTVTGNTVRGATGFALDLTVESGFGGNTLTENNGGNANWQVSGGREIATNVCGTGTQCVEPVEGTQ